jgi:predicted AlkP superfamily pyrophosphatase or phosphodiesterase
MNERSTEEPTVVPQPVLPAYGAACIDSLAPALLSLPSARPSWLPPEVQTASQVVLLVLDGLGWRQLQDRRDLAPNLAALSGGPITSVVPTTTATALTSIALGASPAAHGMVGYRVRVEGPTGDEVMNVLRWRTVSGDARPFVPPGSFQPTPAFQGLGVPVVTRAEFLSSGFTAAHLTGARQIGWWLPSSLVVEVGRALAEGEPFVYAYYDGIDKTAHGYGFGEHYNAELRWADRLVGDLIDQLPPGAALVVTADHGQVEVGHAVRHLEAEILADTAMVSGEGRFRWLHAQPGRAGDLADAVRDRYRSEAWVWTVEELDRGGLFGSGLFGGRLNRVTRARLGDVALVPWEPVAYLDPADQGDATLVCRHGSLTEAEMLVPLLGTAR